MKKVLVIYLFVLLTISSNSLLYAEPAANLDALVESVKHSRVSEEEINRKREARFLANKNKQIELLSNAVKELRNQQKRSDELTKISEKNEKKLLQLGKTLHIRVGNLGEVFGVVRQAAQDLLALRNDSFVAAQISDQGTLLERLSRSKTFPRLEDLEKLWFVFLQEMTESGKIVKFSAEVVGSEGNTREQEVTRVGVFTAVSEGKFLRYSPEMKKLMEFTRQPAGRYLNLAEKLETSTSGYVETVIDPTRGSFLGLLTQRPTFVERIRQGGVVGYIIIALGVLGLAIAVWRLGILMKISQRVQSQMLTPLKPRRDNPLGRVLLVYRENEEYSLEALEIKLDEAIVRETWPFERWQSAIKLFSAITPLLGLLGTVIGMIATFHVITVLGTGDPKVMAGGISQALVTTMLGLVAAVPLLLSHGVLTSRSRALIQILEEQSAGLMARSIEKEIQAEKCSDSLKQSLAS